MAFIAGYVGQKINPSALGEKVSAISNYVQRRPISFRHIAYRNALGPLSSLSIKRIIRSNPAS